LLDEPVAGIAPEMIEKILSVVQSLPAQGKSVMLIEHNLDAVMRVCDRVLFMDAGAKISVGTPQEVRNDPKVIDTYIVYPYPLSRQKTVLSKVELSTCIKAVGTEGARRATGVPTAAPYTSAGVR
jgi:energy-coupling factor transporter ATP-binding protein EcfA2